MAQIRRLSEMVVSQIAAGEVIERPAYAVKELVDNALDATADTITIEIVDSGLSRISVTDNGIGMDQEDLLLSFQPHTTSKLTDDILVGITTRGFRGEALASIASISQMRIASRTQASLAGVAVTVNQGVVEQLSRVGMSQGTRVDIEGLFSMVPVRKKFLKSAQTEYRQIVDVVTSLALAHPHIRFRLTHNGKVAFGVAPASPLDRVRDLLGESVANHLIPVDYEDSYIRIQGFLGKPLINSTHSHKIHLTVNHRPVVNKLVTLALKEAYGSLLDPHVYPIIVLNLTLPFEMVDVNVHPRKHEIQLMNERHVFDVVKAGVMETLTNHNLTFGQQTGWSAPKDTGSFIATQLKETVLTANPLAKTQLTENDQVLQVHNSYLMVQTAEGVLIVDQHAAHERVLYEQFTRAYHESADRMTEVSVTIPFPVTPTEALLLEEYSAQLAECGVRYQKHDVGTYLLTSIPRFYEGRDAHAFINALLEQLEQGLPLPSIDRHTEDLIHFLACKGAVKAGDPLTQAQRLELYEQLSHCSLPYTCPHGRPTHVVLDLTELKKLFKRG